MARALEEEQVRNAAFEALLRERRQRLADHEAGHSVLSDTEANKVRDEIESLQQALASRRD